MHKNYFLGLCALTVTGCGVQNDITFTTTSGSCADGTTGAPYCMAVTILNNSGGQNFINSTNFPISNLSLSLTGSSNINYPTNVGSSYDPNNCLGSTVSPGGQCTFYLQLTGESVPVGQSQGISIVANYTVNSDLFGGGTNTSSTTLSVSQLSNLLLSTSGGWVESYNIYGLSGAYRGESEATNNAVVNDNYYGFLYMAGNNGIYFSGNGSYLGNVTNGSSSIQGATNLLINGQTLYGVPTGSSLSSSVYSANIKAESFNWQQYSTGIPSVARTNVSVLSGTRIFVAPSSAAQVEVCLGSPTNNCVPEGVIIPGASSINALAFGNIGSLSSGATPTGLVAGADNGLWIESGSIAPITPANNGWVQALIAGSTPLHTSIKVIVADASLNLYIADAGGILYVLPVNNGNNVTQQTNWSAVVGQDVTAMVYDNNGATLYVASNSGTVYACANIAGGSCKVLLQNIYSGSLNGLNIVSSLN